MSKKETKIDETSPEYELARELITGEFNNAFPDNGQDATGAEINALVQIIKEQQKKTPALDAVVNSAAVNEYLTGLSKTHGKMEHGGTVKNKYEVELSAVPNHDFSIEAPEYSVKIKKHKVPVSSLAEARAKTLNFIAEHNLGGGNFPNANLYRNGRKIGEISYNGKVWNMDNKEMKTLPDDSHTETTYEELMSFTTLKDISYFKRKYSDGSLMSSWLKPLQQYYVKAKAHLHAARMKEAPDTEKIKFLKEQVEILEPLNTDFYKEVVSKGYGKGGSVKTNLADIVKYYEGRGAISFARDLAEYYAATHGGHDSWADWFDQEGWKDFENSPHDAHAVVEESILDHDLHSHDNFQAPVTLKMVTEAFQTYSVDADKFLAMAKNEMEAGGEVDKHGIPTRAAIIELLEKELGAIKVLNKATNYLQIQTPERFPYHKGEIKEFQIDYHKKNWYEFKTGGTSDNPTETFVRNITAPKLEQGGGIDTPQILGYELKQFFKNKYGIEIRTRYIKTVRGLDNSWYEISTYRTGGIIPNEVRKEIVEIMGGGKTLAEQGVLNQENINYGNVREQNVAAYGKAWKIFLDRHKGEYAGGGYVAPDFEKDAIEFYGEKEWAAATPEEKRQFLVEIEKGWERSQHFATGGEVDTPEMNFKKGDVWVNQLYAQHPELVHGSSIMKNDAAFNLAITSERELEQMDGCKAEVEYISEGAFGGTAKHTDTGTIRVEHLQSNFPHFERSKSVMFFVGKKTTKYRPLSVWNGNMVTKITVLDTGKIDRSYPPEIYKDAVEGIEETLAKAARFEFDGQYEMLKDLEKNDTRILRVMNGNIKADKAVIMELLRKFDKVRDDYTFAKAAQSGDYYEKIKSGRMTADRVIEILNSKNIPVPQNILELQSQKNFANGGEVDKYNVSTSRLAFDVLNEIVRQKLLSDSEVNALSKKARHGTPEEVVEARVELIKLMDKLHPNTKAKLENKYTYATGGNLRQFKPTYRPAPVKHYYQRYGEGGAVSVAEIMSNNFLLGDAKASGEFDFYTEMYDQHQMARFLTLLNKNNIPYVAEREAKFWVILVLQKDKSKVHQLYIPFMKNDENDFEQGQEVAGEFKQGGNISRDRMFVSKEAWEQAYFPHRVSRAKHYHHHYAAGGKVGSALAYLKTLDLTALPANVAQHIQGMMEHPEINLLDASDVDFVELKQYIEEKFGDAVRKKAPAKQEVKPQPVKQLPVKEIVVKEPEKTPVAVLRTRIKVIKGMIADGDKSVTLKTRIKIIEGMIAEAESATGKQTAVKKEVEIEEVAKTQTAIKEIVAKLQTHPDKKTMNQLLNWEWIKKLRNAGYTTQEVLYIMLGYLTVHSIQAGDKAYYPTGITNFHDDVIEEYINSYVNAAETNSYELGIKNGEFNWSGIIKKYGISTTPKTISVEKTKSHEDEFEIFIGKNVVIGHSIRYKTKGEKDWTEQSEPAKAGKFNHGYWGIVSSDKKIIEDIADTLMKQKSGNLGDLEIFLNGLGGVSADNLKEAAIKYCTGGAVEYAGGGKVYGLEVQKTEGGVWEQVNKEPMTKEEANAMKQQYEKSGIKYHALKVDVPLPFEAGGELEFKRGGEVNGTTLTFKKVDYDTNVDLKNLEVDVNIKASDSVDQLGLNDTDAEWKQYHWGYMVYPKTKEQLFAVLRTLKIQFNQNRIEKILEESGYIEQPERDEPQEDDNFISDARGGGYNVSWDGKFRGHYDNFEDALEAITEEQDRSKVWNNIWTVDERGSTDLIDREGNRIKMAAGGKVDDDQLEEVLSHYIAAALWSSTDTEEKPLDSNYTKEDISESAMNKMRFNVKHFLEATEDAVKESGLTNEQIGHSLWLTQNHHGSGFMDYNLDKAVEDKLTKAAHQLGEHYLEIGDNGKIYKRGGKLGKVKSAIGDIAKIECYYNFSVKGNGNQIPANKVPAQMIDDYVMFLSDKEFLEKYAKEIPASVDEDDFSENGNMDEFRVTQEYYITFKDGSEIFVDFSLPDFNFQDAGIRDEEESKGKLAEKWLPEFNSYGWDMDIDSLAEAVNGATGSNYAKGGGVKYHATRRVNNSPLLEYANFEDGSHINLLRLVRPYKSGHSYAISVSNIEHGQNVTLFKTLPEAEKSFKEQVAKKATLSKVVKLGNVPANYGKGGKVTASTEDMELASQLIAGEISNFDSDPIGFMEAMGWDKQTHGWVSGLDGTISASLEQTQQLASIIANERAKGLQGLDLIEANSVQDWLTNFVAGELNNHPENPRKKSTGGLTADKKWIDDAIKHKGALRKKAKALGLIKGDEPLTEKHFLELENLGKSWKKKVDLARTLAKFHADGGTVDAPVSSTPRKKTIEGVKHTKAVNFDYHSAKRSDIVHPLGDVYVKAKSGYVASGYDWYKFNLERWQNRKAK